MNALTLYYDPEVWYKNNLIFHFMNIKGKLKKFVREKNNK